MSVAHLTAPPKIIAIDTETTGLDASRHDIIEIAIKVIDALRGKIFGSFEAVVKLSEKSWKNADPNALKVNRFTFEEIQKRGVEKSFIKEKILELFKKTQIDFRQDSFMAQNSYFDRTFFCQLFSPEEQRKHKMPYCWIDLASIHYGKTAIEMFQNKRKKSIIPFSKDKMAVFRGLEPEKSLHRAMNGVDHMLSIYYELLFF